MGWADGVDPDALAARIRREVAGVNVAAPGEVARQLAASTAFFSWLMAGIAGIGLLIGGLSLSNTVAASTFERIRDFGIKQDGATDLHLLGEVLRESLAVSLGGGLLGTALAVLLGIWGRRPGGQGGTGAVPLLGPPGRFRSRVRGRSRGRRGRLCDRPDSAGRHRPRRSAAEPETMNTGATLLRASSLAKRFRTPDGRVLEVLRRVDLALAPGELVAVIGRSGSGKSTLLNLLGCLDRSDGGELWFRDQRLTGASRRAMAGFRGRHLGFVFQTYNLIPELTARENVLLAARYVGRARAEAETAARDLLERLGVWERAEQYPPALGGEQQRVARSAAPS